MTRRTDAVQRATSNKGRRLSEVVRQIHSGDGGHQETQDGGALSHNAKISRCAPGLLSNHVARVYEALPVAPVGHTALSAHGVPTR